MADNKFVTSDWKLIDVDKNDALNEEGTIDQNIYFVEKGIFLVTVRDIEAEQVIRIGYAGDYIVALDSFISNRKSSLLIRSIKKGKLRVASRNFLMGDNMDFKATRIWIKTLEQIILDQSEREIDLAITSPSDRYLRVLKRSPRLFQEVPSKYIANYLRMAPETLSRIKKS